MVSPLSVCQHGQLREGAPYEQKRHCAVEQTAAGAEEFFERRADSGPTAGADEARGGYREGEERYDARVVVVGEYEYGERRDGAEDYARVEELHRYSAEERAAAAARGLVCRAPYAPRRPSAERHTLQAVHKI